MRLNRYISLCGLASRRAADLLIANGKVTVNGETVIKLGTNIDENTDQITVDGRPCVRPSEHVYLALYKPKGYLVTLKDDFGRRTIRWLLRGLKQRVYPVGRLDLDSEGLLLLTDDGELAFRLAHPSYGVKKLYHVSVKGRLGQEDLRHFFDGIQLEDGHIAKARVKILESEEDTTLLSIELTEGRKREIRRMCKIIGFPVIALTRIKYDEIPLTGLERGKWRFLSPHEVDRLKKKVGLH